MSKSLHVKYPLFLSDFNETSIFSIDFRKSSNITFHQNPSKGSRVVLYGQTDMTKQTLAFRNFANAHKNIVEPERTQTIWRLRVAYWIRKNACTRASTRARSCIHTHPPTHPHTHTHTQLHTHTHPPTHTHPHTLTPICNTYCFSTATMLRYPYIACRFIYYIYTVYCATRNTATNFSSEKPLIKLGKVSVLRKKKK